MAHLRRRRRPSAATLLQLAAAIAIAVTIAAGRSESRELRPSDHGLDSQADPGPATAGMRAFFGGSVAADNTALPYARINSTGSDGGGFWPTGRGRGRGGDVHVRLVLLVISVVCGGAGLALLLAAAVFCFLRGRNKSTIN